MIPSLDPEFIHTAVNAALGEDIGRGDITTRATVRPGLKARGQFLAKQDFILAGLEVAEAVFASLDYQLQIEASAADGDELTAGRAFGRVTGEAQVLLTAERVALNFLQRLSGIATIARAYAAAVVGTKARIVDTRKTTPGLRMLEKYAVTVGGCYNHRFGLDDGVLIKDNHIALSGGVGEAVRRAREATGHLHRIEVEAATFEQVRDALQAGADVIMLDNMSPEMVRQAVTTVKEKNSQVLIEASGGITLENVRAYAEAGADLISIGALTHSAPAVDISFKIRTV